jgi:hypothetical protein
MNTSEEENWQGPPPYDPAAVGRVAELVQIQNIELLGSHFERADDGFFATTSPADATTPELGIGQPRWEVDPEALLLACVLSFATQFPGHEDDPPYFVMADFRVTYSLTSSAIEPADMEQFVSWNAVFNAWPYWREYLSSTINRAGLPRFVASVMGVPRQEVAAQ